MKTTSTPGNPSTAVVQGMRGEFAVTSAGAATPWARNAPSTSSNLLTEVVPMLNEGGTKASATGAVTAYVNGIKLVRAPIFDNLFRLENLLKAWPFP
jgi:hypothetical protein